MATTRTPLELATNVMLHWNIIAAEETASGMRFVCQPMLPWKIYNVPRNVWHNIVIGEAGKVLIVENRDTHLGDFEYRELSASEYEELQKMLAKFNCKYCK